jgi:hypothetical protein
MKLVPWSPRITPDSRAIIHGRGILERLLRSTDRRPGQPCGCHVPNPSDPPVPCT